MPNAPLRFCATVGCAERVRSGHCDRHRQATERARRETRGFDYSAPWWRGWRRYFVGQLIALGLTPRCGMSLAGLHPELSTCLQEGRYTSASTDGTSLHLHHEPELTSMEVAHIKAGRHDIACAEDRIVLLCRRCHSQITGGYRNV